LPLAGTEDVEADAVTDMSARGTTVWQMRTCFRLPWIFLTTILQRFFSTTLPWASLFWVFFRTHLFHADEVYLLGGDETVVTKAGKQPHGLDRFFAGLYGKPVPGLAFFTLSLISTTQRRSFPIHIEQVVRTPEEKATARAKVTAKTTAALTRKPAGRWNKPTTRCMCARRNGGTRGKRKRSAHNPLKSSGTSPKLPDRCGVAEIAGSGDHLSG